MNDQMPPEDRVEPSSHDDDEERMQSLDQSRQLEGIRTELSAFNAKVDDLVAVLEGLRALGQGSGRGTKEEPGSNVETETEVTQEHDYDTDELENLAYDWINAAGDFHNDLITEPVEIEFAQVGGQVGLKIEAGAPWNAGCHNGDGWTDKDAWDDHREAFKSIVDRDEIEYHGEPDYFNFLAADDVEEVCG